MTVSRRGKRGKTKLRPASRNGRVRVNASMKNVAKIQDLRPTANRQSKEQWVLNCVARIVGTKRGEGFVQADDVASDIILALLDVGGFNWEEDDIERFCRKKAAYMVLQYLGRRERSECEFSVEGDDGTLSPILTVLAVERAMQETILEAKEAASLLPLLPNAHREALEILCDGGNPIDVAEELNIRPWDAIVLIKEAREYIRRVGPLEEAA